MNNQRNAQLGNSNNMGLAAFRRIAISFLLVTFALALTGTTCLTFAQTHTADSAVPRLVNYAGVARDLNGKPFKAVVGATFAVYSQEEGGAPLWMETQNIEANSNGSFTVMLGTTETDGLPLDLFASGQARWLGISFNGEAEQPRVALLSVPYALKAGDAETIGGLPPSAFVLAVPSAPSNSAAPIGQSTTTSVAAAVAPATSSNVTTTGGAVNAIPLFTTATNIQKSILSETGTTAINIGGKLNLPATGTATAMKGFNSRPQDFVASVFNSGTSTVVPQTFQLEAEPAGNNTAAASGTLNLLYGSGTAAPTETGLRISNKGIVTFGAGQTFPGTGKGTVTSVALSAPATDFEVTGSPVTTAGTVALAWNVAPTSNDTANAIVKRDGSGSFQATNITGSGTFSVTTANASAISAISSLDGGVAIRGQSTSTGTSSISYGVEGSSTSGVSGSSAVLGLDNNTSSAGGAFTIGVQGFTANPNGFGVAGFTTGLSGMGALYHGSSGVWGDGGYIGSFGVLGTSDNYPAGVFANNSPDGYHTVLIQAGNAQSSPLYVATATGAICVINQNADLYCSGTVSGSAVLDAGKRKVALSAIESPQNWFEDAGSAQLVNGAAIVKLDPDFIQTVNTEMDYKVFPVPNGDCKGLYVTNKRATSFEVRELSGGASSVTFDYRIMALRKKYENVRFADHTNDLDPRKMMERMRDGRAPRHSQAEVSTMPPGSAAPPQDRATAGLR